MNNHSRTLLLLAAFLAPVALHAQSITGTVTDKTTGKPSAGDTVVLIKLANGMQPANQTTTDARGHYVLPVDDQGMHLVRVDHQKTPYFQPVTPGTTKVDVDVYDVAEKVEGITGNADVMRLQATDTSLEVTELFDIQNNSSPARTQFSARAFEIFLPPQAEITGGAALGPGGMPVQKQPVPTGEPGHFAFIFPLRPGETQFQVAYKLPYLGKFTFAPHISVPMQSVAVMVPDTMKFDPAKGTAFQPVHDETIKAQIFVVKDASTSQPLGFTASGTGEMPKETSADANAAPPAADANGGAMPAAADNRPGGGLGNPIDTPDPLHKYRWWVLGIIAVLFGAGIAFAMRKPAGTPTPDPMSYGLAPAAPAPANRSDALLQTLKDEMFTLETDRVEGRVTEEEYAAVKAALERVLRHALQRNNRASHASK